MLGQLLPPSLRSVLGPWHRRAVEFNRERELYPWRHSVDSATYRSYDYLGTPSDVLFEEFLDCVTPGDVVFDVGAHVGRYSLPLAASGANVRCNDLPVTVINAGMAETVGEMEFHVSSDPARSSFNRYNATYDDSSVVETIPVGVTTVDDVVTSRRAPPPDHLKVDAEGLGLEVLRGAEETLAEHRPVVYFEPHEVHDDEYRTDELYAFFDGVSYEVREHDYPWVCRPVGEKRKGEGAREREKTEAPVSVQHSDQPQASQVLQPSE